MKLGMPHINFRGLRLPVPEALQGRVGEATGRTHGEDRQPSMRPAPPDTRMGEIRKRLGAWLKDGVRVGGNIAILTKEDLPRILRVEERSKGAEKSAYHKLEKAVNTAHERMALLDRLSPRDVLTDEGHALLANAVQAQHTVFQTARALQNARTDTTMDPGLVRLMADSQSRAGELLHFAARMQPERTPDGWRMMIPEEKGAPDTTLLRAARSLAADMHGTSALLDSLARTARPLFDQVDTLARDYQTMDKDAFRERVASVELKILRLQMGIQAVLNPTTTEETPRLQGDFHLFSALNAQLGAALQRVDGLKRAPNFPEVIRNHAAALVEQPKFSDLAEEVRLPDSVKTALRRLDQGTQRMRESLGTHLRADFNPSKAAHELSSLQNDFKADMQLCRAFALLALADADEGTVGSIRDYSAMLRRRIPGLAREQAQSLAVDLAGVVNELVDDPQGRDRLENLKGALAHSLFNLSPSRLRAEMRELELLGVRSKEEDARRAAYIAQAFENDFSISTLAEACARGLDPECVDFSVHDRALTGPPTELGSGACNAVQLCVYRDARGVETSRVFKGEISARRGIAQLRLGKLGYDPLARAVQLNVATLHAAQAIGCGDVVARTSAGVLNGRFGMFMERAPGQTAADFNDLEDDDVAVKVAKTEEGVELNPTQLYAYLEKKGLMPTVRANLQRELCRLEWADLLSAQGDRHQSNYLVDIHPDSGAVRVTGIDNDASFGFLMVGAGRVDVTSTSFEGLHDLAKDMELGGRLRKVVDLESLHDGDKLRVRNVFGFNQMFIPELIDQTTFDALMDIDELTYAAALSINLDANAVQSALFRLRDAKELARGFQSSGRVIQDWKDDLIPLNPNTLPEGGVSVTEFYNALRKNAVAEGNTGSLGFYSRDFATLLA